MNSKYSSGKRKRDLKISFILQQSVLQMEKWLLPTYFQYVLYTFMLYIYVCVWFTQARITGINWDLSSIPSQTDPR